MYKLRIFCNDVDTQWWEDGVYEYETYDKALIACYESSISECSGLMATSDYYTWFEVYPYFEVTEGYANDLVEEGTIFPVVTLFYDHAPWDRENDCDIRIVTGYKIVEVAKGE